MHLLKTRGVENMAALIWENANKFHSQLNEVGDFSEFFTLYSTHN